MKHGVYAPVSLGLFDIKTSYFFVIFLCALSAFVLIN